MSKITCALSGPQIENLFKVTYKAMKNALEAGEAFNADLFMSDLFDKIATKKDLATAVLFIQQVPSLIYTAAGQSNLLPLEFVGDKDVRKLMRQYKDPTNGFNLVLSTYAPTATPEEVLQATVVQNSLVGKPTLEATGTPPTGSAEVERMKPFTTLTSTFMEFVKLDPNATEVLTKEKIDPNRMRIYNTIEKIRDSIPVDITPFTEIVYKGKVIKLKAIKLTKLDQNMLDKTTKDEIVKSFSIKPKDSKVDVFYKGEIVVQADDRVALVLCNEKGDFI